MGQSKLLLPLGTKTVIARVIDVLDRPEILEITVVIRPDDDVLRTVLESLTAVIVQPSEEPQEMRESVQFALDQIDKKHSPMDDDGWLLVPADQPVLDTEVLDVVLQRWQQGDCQILVPRFGDQRGHPTLFQWKLADEISQIPCGHGLNWLLHKHAEKVIELEIDRPAVITDLNTPEDYQQLLERWTEH